MMIYKRVIYFLIFISVLGNWSCNEILNVDIVGDGNLKTDTLENLSSFSGIYLDSDFEIVLTSGEDQEVWVKADSNLLENDYINIEVDDDWLNVGVKPNFNIAPRQPVRVYIQIPPESRISEAEVVNGGTIIADSLSISKFSVSVLGISVFRGTEVISDSLEIIAEGSTTINIDGEIKKRLFLHQKGSGNMLLTGNSALNEILLEGSGKIDGKSMTMNDANISIYGSGLVLCRVPGTLSALIDGSGRIYYYGGHPENLDKEIIGEEGEILPGG